MTITKNLNEKGIFTFAIMLLLAVFFVIFFCNFVFELRDSFFAPPLLSQIFYPWGITDKIVGQNRKSTKNVWNKSF